MSEKLISTSRIKEILNMIKSHHNSRYDRIADLHKLFNTDKQEWPINEVIDELKDSLDVFEKKGDLLNRKINRKETKIFLFGKVSVGKSKVLNCLLRSDLFVSSVGHTTSCFVHVMKSQNSRYVIKYKNKEEVFDDVDKLKSRMETLGTGHDMHNQEKLKVDESIEFHLPIKDNKILKEGTHIIDCPGAGNQDSITNAIMKHSEDADIFIFVMSNALTEDDKKFFKYQSKVSCKPDVFILVNKWDETKYDTDDATIKSKVSIIQQCSDFLINECNLDGSKLEDRTFFVSAVEIFLLQVNCKTDEVKMNEKVKERCENFDKFEQKLQQYVANPQQSKARRYKKEIDQINCDIEKIWTDGKQKILNMRRSTTKINIVNLTRSVRELKTSLKEPFEKLKLKLRNQINCQIDNLDDSVTTLDDIRVNDEISLLKKELENEIESFTKDQKKKIVNYFKVNLADSNEMRNQIKISKICEGLETLHTSVKKPEAEKYEGSLDINNYAPLLVIPVLGVIAFGVAQAITGSQKQNRKHEALKNNIIIMKGQLDNIKKNIITQCEKCIETVRDHFNKLLTSLADSIEQLKKLTDAYWEEMNRILEQ